MSALALTVAFLEEFARAFKDAHLLCLLISLFLADQAFDIFREQAGKGLVFCNSQMLRFF